MIMCATVTGTEDGRLLVMNEANQQEVTVNTCCTNFNQGERVKIIYNGMMTFSLPPQITAKKIIRLNCN